MMADKARLPAPLEEAVKFVMSWLEHSPIIEMPASCLKHYLVTILLPPCHEQWASSSIQAW